ncbi:MAG: glucose dehydrogenase [Anaerolineae bacterium]|nr:glucose dehydrogenase [Anaerolineae bacterium]MBT7069614.1 glucose dehydrogenase [Anaerolineae bacterium]MBT7324533.1 glucose dehydrogenase [Anaerolineae bacterium]
MKKLILGLILLLGLTACSTAPAPTPQPAPVIATAAPAPTDAATPAPIAEENAPEAPAAVTDFPDPMQYMWTLAVSGFDQPLDIQNAGDGSGRLFVVERGGRIRVVENNLLLDEPFLDISKKVRTGGSEQGLLGLAFHPHYLQNGIFFINYTDVNGNTVIARYQVSGNANQADRKSEAVLLHIEQPYGNHNGGGIAFGPDGFLYIGLGDGGSSDDPKGHGQNLNSYLGTLLRIDVDGGESYVVPADNPFLKGEGLPEIWAYGLRNPWRFSFDSLTGDLYIADVGQNEWEEIDFLPAGSAGGANFGWNFMEGTHIFVLEPPESLGVIAPVAEYNHDDGCSVTGGNVYRGNELPEWQGVYFYGDFCSGAIWGLLSVDGTWRSEPLFYTGALLSSFGEGEDSTLYYADYNTEAIYRLIRK